MVWYLIFFGFLYKTCLHPIQCKDALLLRAKGSDLSSIRGRQFGVKWYHFCSPPRRRFWLKLQKHFLKVRRVSLREYAKMLLAVWIQRNVSLISTPSIKILKEMFVMYGNLFWNFYFQDILGNIVFIFSFILRFNIYYLFYIHWLLRYINSRSK